LAGVELDLLADPIDAVWPVGANQDFVVRRVERQRLAALENQIRLFESAVLDCGDRLLQRAVANVIELDERLANELSHVYHFAFSFWRSLFDAGSRAPATAAQFHGLRRTCSKIRIGSVGRP
jgi:hypothetical protein